MIFDATEIATLKKFFALVAEHWITDGSWTSDGIVGADDDGIQFIEFSAATDYDGCSLEREETVLPWLALTDPDQYDRQLNEAAEERRREDAARQQVYLTEREAKERATLAALKAKYDAQ